MDVWNQTLGADYDCNPSDGFDCKVNNHTHVYMPEPNDMLDPFNINPAFLTIVVTHAITFFVGIIGNSVVIATWARGGKLRSSTATFLVSLACADLLLLFIYVPLETLEYFVITWDIDGNICKLSSFVEMLSGMASVLNLVAVSVERFLVIVYPIRARRWCTVSKSRRSLVLVWSLAILFAAPIVFNKNMYSITYYNNVTSLTAYYCWESDDHWALFISVYQLMALFVIPAFLMIICYFCVIRELWASTKVITTLTTPSYNSNGMRVHKDGQSYLVRWPSKRLTSISINCNSSCYSNSSNDNPSSNTYNSTGSNTNNNNNPINNQNNNNNNNNQNNNSINSNKIKINNSCGLHNNNHRNYNIQIQTENSSINNSFDFMHSQYETIHTIPKYQSPVTDIRNARKQVIKMLLFIVIIFHICWGPRLIMNVIITMGLTNYDQFTYSARVAFYLLSFIHSALNPFVYGFMSSNFRRMMLNSCHQRSSNCHQNNGSIQDLAGTSSCVNMSHFNFNAINYSNTNRRTNDSSDVYMPSVINAIHSVSNANELSANHEDSATRSSVSEGFTRNQCQNGNSSHSF